MASVTSVQSQIMQARTNVRGNNICACSAFSKSTVHIKQPPQSVFDLDILNDLQPFFFPNPQTLNPRGNELCRMSLTFARIWRIPCPVCGVHSSAIGEYSNKLFTLHCWLVCIVYQLSGKSSFMTSQLVSRWLVKWGKSEPNPSVLTWEDFHVNKQLICCWINAPKQLRLNNCVVAAWSVATWFTSGFHPS